MKRRRFLSLLGLATTVLVLAHVPMQFLIGPPPVGGLVSYRFKYTVTPAPSADLRLRFRRMAEAEGVVS